MTTVLTTINWTPKKLRRFRAAYQQAVLGKVELFIFEGNEFVTNYAKYLIQYLESQGV